MSGIEIHTLTVKSLKSESDISRPGVEAYADYCLGTHYVILKHQAYRPGLSIHTSVSVSPPTGPSIGFRSKWRWKEAHSLDIRSSLALQSKYRVPMFAPSCPIICLEAIQKQKGQSLCEMRLTLSRPLENHICNSPNCISPL